ncbi:MAG: flagellar biosynthesis anti-sigma factor FlgM [Treponema sp.]|nr:flagellar biosynthesis anti-sigma factor FlgM [Treponema sp.]
MSMTVDRIGSIDPIQPGKKPGKASQVNESPRTDSISISSEAQEKAELLRTQELVAAAPEVRAERIAELKEKINDPSYIDEKIINATANKLIDSLFG